jgi:hypothetical protein
VDMLRRIVDLVEACTFADNPQWRSETRVLLVGNLHVCIKTLYYVEVSENSVSFQK